MRSTFILVSLNRHPDKMQKIKNDIVQKEITNKYGQVHLSPAITILLNRCVDSEIMLRLFPDDKKIQNSRQSSLDALGKAIVFQIDMERRMANSRNLSRRRSLLR